MTRFPSCYNEDNQPNPEYQKFYGLTDEEFKRRVTPNDHEQHALAEDINAHEAGPAYNEMDAAIDLKIQAVQKAYRAGLNQRGLILRGVDPMLQGFHAPHLFRAFPEYLASINQLICEEKIHFLGPERGTKRELVEINNTTQHNWDAMSAAANYWAEKVEEASVTLRKLMSNNGDINTHAVMLECAGILVHGWHAYIIVPVSVETLRIRFAISRWDA